MKKKNRLLIISSATCALVAGIAAFTASNHADIVRAGKAKVPHQIVLDYSNVYDPSFDEWGVAFQLKKENATRSGDTFQTAPGSVYCYGEQDVTAKQNGHICTASFEYYASVYFGFYFEFSNVEEYSNVTVRGEFYYNQYLTDPETELVYDKTYFSENSLTVYESNFYKIVIDLIEINYYCAA